MSSRAVFWRGNLSQRLFHPVAVVRNRRGFYATGSMIRNNESGSTARIQALTDGVYAIAMTILVLGLRVPVVAHNSAAVQAALVDLAPKFVDVIISFLLLGVFWTIHHRQFQMIKQTDKLLLWINIFSLLFVVMVPFSTSLFGEYRNVTAAAVFFNLNIFILGAFKWLQWRYVTWNKRLVGHELEDSVIVEGLKLNLVTPAVALTAVGTAFVAPGLSTNLFLLVPVILSGVRRT